MNKKENRSTPRHKKKIKPHQEDRTTIRVGDISGGTGFAIGPGAEANVTQIQGTDSDQISRAFGELRRQLEQLPQGPDKKMAETALTVLEEEAKKGDQASESTVQKWITFLAETAPDVWEVAIDTFINPVKGIGTIFKKVAAKARAARDAPKVQAPKRA
jgi:hypothetical protein